jgi:hypothetical protein
MGRAPARGAAGTVAGPPAAQQLALDGVLGRYEMS